MTSTRLGFAQCADEPIRVPGAIQPHGHLFCLDAHTLAVKAYSAAIGALFSSASGGPVDIVEAVEALRPSLPAFDAAQLHAGEPPQYLGVATMAGRAHEVMVHRVEELLVFEWVAAPADLEGTAGESMYAMVRLLVPQLQKAESVGALVQLAADEMARLTGFGRSLVYSFDAEDHGRVLAEHCDAGYDSYAGHRFPAPDIPQQARDLYRVNHIRLIPNAIYEPVPLVWVATEDADRALDLTFATLRSVSPIHLEYMRNMGTLSSMSVSIMVRGQLWGLISCHNHAARYVSYQTRLACEHLGQLLSLQIEAKEDHAEAAERLELRQLTLDTVARLTDADATLQQLVREPASFLRLARASGAAVLLNDECWTVGDTPSRPQIMALAEWVGSQTQDVFASDRLSEVFPEAAGYAAVASGVLAISISQVHRQLILWFRAEIVQSIAWAGDPRKQPRDADGQLHPRRSFSTWREVVHARSLPWRPSELAAARELRQALVEIVLHRAEELADLASELGRVNKELEAFSYSVSHDLRSPMRHILGYVDMLLEMEGQALSERGRRYLANVQSAAQFAGELVDALLEFSRMGRAALKPTEVDPNVIVHAIVQELNADLLGRTVQWTVQALPTVWGDPLFLQVALRNLLSNAVKYSRDREVARIEVRADEQTDRQFIHVTDNGIGFNMKYVDKLFGVFQRLHTSEQFEGTGIGLANVRRIVERHGGEVRAQGTPGQGATFSIGLPRRPSAGAQGPATTLPGVL